jgi:hypothetical protein
MRKVGIWRKELEKDFSAFKQSYGPLLIAVSELLDIELILTTMKVSFPGQNPFLAWAVLNGQQLPALETLSAQQKKAIAVTRLHLPASVGRRYWERILKVYVKLPSHYPLYQIDEGTIIERPNAILQIERNEAIRLALSSPPEWKSRTAYYASPGHYRFSMQQDWYEVELPKRIENLTSDENYDLGDERSPKHHPLEISLEDLQVEADWMDRMAPAGSIAAQSWGIRLRAIQFRLINQTGLQPSSHMRLDGLLHLIGMVGSGKSSFFTVLTVYLARRGYRVMMVLSDVAAMFREQEIFEILCRADPQALRAVPLLGRSSRVAHLNRLYRALAVRDSISLRQYHPAYPFLSTICSLDGLRQDVRAIYPGNEPCTRLYDAESSGTEDRYDCPFLPVCPVHHATRSLAQTRIWLATPASLLASGPQTPLMSINMRYVDLVMRHVHVVLVDEADLVQVQFDDRFAPMEVLVRDQGESWLDRMALQVARQIYRAGRPLVGRKPDLDRWLIAHDNTQRAVNRLYSLLRDKESVTRKWLGNNYFSHDILISRLTYELRHLLPTIDLFSKQAQTFKFNPLVSTPDSTTSENTPPLVWYNALHLEMLESSRNQAILLLEKWICEVGNEKTRALHKQQINHLALHLLVMLLVITLDHALQEMILIWPAAEELGIDRGRGGFFYNPSEDQLRIVPEPPMGAVIGFQYYDTENDGNGELRFFHVQGLGRSLLYHLHDALKDSDEIVGPHVILTSGTSWAPQSWKYHLAQAPGAVLLPQATERKANQETSKGRVQCFYDPLPDPSAPGKYLHVSGHKEPERRIRSLRSVVDALIRPQGFRASMFEEELSLLEEHRRRILLIVGSYAEAEAVGETLATLFTEQYQHYSPEDVLALIPDSEGEGNDTWQLPPGKLLRSLLNQMPKLSARFLVAPLQSIERGHNILVGQEAAIGSVYFLVRPYPVPGDIHAAIHKLNAWSYDFLPQLQGKTATEAGLSLRLAASVEWDKALSKEKMYKRLDDDERDPLLWTQFVLVWQCIGRLLRGGASARVHFVDARWAENTLTGKFDTEKTSMLVGFRNILRAAVTHPDAATRAIAQTLYGEAALAFENVQGVHYA